ncbi:hypothetical protein EE896_22000 (plasmid) [Pantoea eucalypti]|uniref:Tail tube protein n=1 Tax=Pantoea eucalypti TaxID=470933 RepID=A0ABY2ZAV4_9GAMM|nr:hypothetical protein [Pantoea eucalypti]QGF29520.1 hypothetical protein EE896_22000 [Pantoea eucalypti]TPV30087.1 hypothetical protein FJW02_20540 [Pantoea eucalypti]
MNNIFNHRTHGLLGAAFDKPAVAEEPAVKDSMLESAGLGNGALDRTVAMFEAVQRRAGEDARSVAASLLAGWVEDGEADSDSFEALALVLAGLDSLSEDDDLDDEQVDAFNAALGQLANAAVAMGADQDDVTSMIDDDDDSAAENVYEALSGLTEDDEAIADYTVAGGEGGEAMLESSTFKAVRDGVVTLVRKRPKKRRMTSLQKQALKKARSKAHSSMANAHRKKSLKLRKKRGL